jgi:hypothetical protein
MPAMLFIASAKLGFLEGVLIVGVSILALPVLYLVHRGLEYCCLIHAQRFCRKNGFEIVRWRCGPAFDCSGIKTEFTLVDLDCLDGRRERKLVRLLVWVFGIRKVLINEKYPESHDETSASS